MSEHYDTGARTGRPPSGAWTGWITFAGVMLIVIGALNVVEGLVALFKDEFYVAGSNTVLVLDLTGWGWVHLTIGVVLVITGPMLWTGAPWARIVTVLVASLNVFAQVAFMAVQPVWSTVAIALCVVVIWAVVVHGTEVGRSR